MKILRNAVSLLTMASMIVTITSVAYGAADEIPQELPRGNVDTIGEFQSLTITIMNWVFTFFLIAAVIFLIVGGFEYFVAADDPEKQKAARSRIIYALIGVAVAVLALTFIRIISRFLLQSETGVEPETVPGPI